MNMIKILKYGDVKNEEIFARAVPKADVAGIVSDIIDNVRKNGDAALLEYCRKFDGAELSSLLVSDEEIQDAVHSTDRAFLDMLERAAANIRRFHECQRRNSFIINDRKGIVMGQKVVPLRRVGLYIPGGTASYPSTVLMNAIPARIAGVEEIVITTPPNSSGSVNPAVLAAAHTAGVDKIFKTGGAQAIAALAFGTESIPAADKITGPGNAFVAEAKKQVFGRVAIDMIAGPSEILIVADSSANPSFLAADMLAQAEHDRMASAVLVTDSADIARAAAEALEEQLAALPRAETAGASIADNGRIIVVDTTEQAVEIANEIAPEHLELCVENPFDILDSVRNAGSVFLGHYTPEALGDYLAGPNHTLPTSGTARFSSPLSVDDFVKKMQYTYYTKDALADTVDDIARFAECEGLSAHARSALIRKDAR